jgi:hypothetical protein
VLALAAGDAAAQAQWSWRDASGNITYSDTPPPSDVQPGSILHQPAVAPANSPNGGGPSGSYSSGAAQPADGSEASAPQAGGRPPAAPQGKSLAEQEAEFRKRAMDREKAEQKAEQDEAQAKERAATCAQAQGYLQMIESGTRLMRPDAEGNRNFMDEDQRAAESEKTRDVIAKNCS